jgi:hypothetical protein
MYVRTDVEQNQYYLSELCLLTVRVMEMEWLTGSKIEQPARRSESLGCEPAEEKQIPLCVPRPSRPATAGRDGTGKKKRGTTFGMTRRNNLCGIESGRSKPRPERFVAGH